MMGRWVFMVLNFILGFLGINVSGLASYILFKSLQFGKVLDAPNFGIIIVIIVGAFMFLLSFYGAYSSPHKDPKSLRVYCFTLGILAVLLIVPFIVFITYRIKVDHIIKTRVNVYFMLFRMAYGKAPDPLSKSIDYLQWAFKCCGYDGPTWWSRKSPEFRYWHSQKYPNYDEMAPISCQMAPTSQTWHARVSLYDIKHFKGCDTELRIKLNLMINMMSTSLVIIDIILLVTVLALHLLVKTSKQTMNHSNTILSTF